MIRAPQIRLLVAFLCAALVVARTQQVSPVGQLHVTVTDQNGEPVPAVVVSVEHDGSIVAQERTAPSGYALLGHLAPGTYKVVLQTEGFYAASVDGVVIAPGQVAPMEVRLQPVREYRTEIEVIAEPSPIDPEQTVSAQSVTASEIATIPYPSTRDYRNVLAYIPGVIADSSGQIHIAGSSTQEIQDYVDGFIVSQPAGGALAIRVNPDSLRKIGVVNSRYSAMFGQGSGGMTDFTIQDGDNRFRFNATDFVPTVQNVKGIQFNNWTPRAYVSGPIVRDKIWFTVSHEGELDNNIVKQLPADADTNRVWRTSDLLRVRMNLTQGNVLTASALWNPFDSDQSGISALDPVSVSTTVQSNLYLLTLKDQITVAQGNLLEFGTGFHRTNTTSVPEGISPYVLTNNGRTGNFFETNATISERTQGFSNLYLKPWKHFGNHQITAGGRVDRILLHQLVARVPIQFCATAACIQDPTQILRQISFQNVPAFDLNTLESSVYIQDRWSALERLVIEGGGRWDHDSFIGQNMFSPRLAGSYFLYRKTETKLSGGIGVYFDRTNLSLVSQAKQGSLTDVFFAPVPATIHSAFVVDPRILTMPRYVNWSLGIETRLPDKIYLQVQYLSRHGAHSWAYVSQPGGDFLLEPTRQDRYDAIQFTVRKEFKRGYPLLLSYTRSSARSNQTVDFSLDNFIVGNQQPGPLPWDAPNQLQSWGSFPLFWKLKKFDLAYSTIWRSGFPFFTVNQFGELVSGPGQFRFPDFINLNVALERKFNFKGYRWGARIGLDDITDRQNPTVVDNNVDSPGFLTFFGQSHRTLNGRIRFLGRATK